MDSGMERRVGAFLPASLALILALTLLTLEASPAAGASRKACRVRNTDTGQTYTRVQQAVQTAKPGTRLVVRGTCRGGTFINKNLVIVGKKTKRTGKPVLDGKNKARVLTINPEAKVSLRSLVIRNGRARRIPNGGGISNKGRLTLRDVVVRGNYATGRGGGIYSEGTLRILGRSRISGNSLRWGESIGPGVYNAGRLVLSDTARIAANICGGLYNVGTVVLNKTSDIASNDYGGRYHDPSVETSRPVRFGGSPAPVTLAQGSSGPHVAHASPA